MWPKKNRFAGLSWQLDNRLYRKSFILIVVDIICKALMFAFSVLVTRYLGVELYGQLIFALAFTNLFFIIADFGVSGLLLKEISSDRGLTKTYLDNFFGLRILLSILMALALFVAHFFLNKPVSIVQMIWGFGLYVLITSTNECITSILNAHEEIDQIALSNLLKTTATLFFCTIFIYLDLGIFSIIISYILGVFCALIFLIGSTRKRIKSFGAALDVKFVLETLKRASPFALSLTFATLYLSIDTILISYFENDDAVGIYSLGYSLTLVFHIIPAAVTKVFFPKLSMYIKSESAKLTSLIRSQIALLCLISVPLISALYYLAPQFFSLVYGASFVESAEIFQIALIALFFKFFSFPAAFILVASGKQNLRVVIQGLTAGINIVGNIVLIPEFGIYGAAAATILSEFILLVLYLTFAVRALKAVY